MQLVIITNGSELRCRRMAGGFCTVCHSRFHAAEFCRPTNPEWDKSSRNDSEPVGAKRDTSM